MITKSKQAKPIKGYIFSKIMPTVIDLAAMFEGGLESLKVAAGRRPIRSFGIAMISGATLSLIGRSMRRLVKQAHFDARSRSGII